MDWGTDQLPSPLFGTPTALGSPWIAPQPHSPGFHDVKSMLKSIGTRESSLGLCESIMPESPSLGWLSTLPELSVSPQPAMMGNHSPIAPAEGDHFVPEMVMVDESSPSVGLWDSVLNELHAESRSFDTNSKLPLLVADAETVQKHLAPSTASSEPSDSGTTASSDEDMTSTRSEIGAIKKPYTLRHGGWRRLASDRKPQPRRFEAVVASITEAEADLLRDAGVTVPEHLPVSKTEEKRVRGALRKIRNKRSAQESRRNKERYIGELEGVLDQQQADNRALVKENISLRTQLLQLQRSVAGRASRSMTHGVQLCMIALCCALVIDTGSSPISDDLGMAPTTGFRSRTLSGLAMSSSPVEAHSNLLVAGIYVCCVALVLGILSRWMPSWLKR